MHTLMIWKNYTNVMAPTLRKKLSVTI